jgi:hypothetical protein
MPYLLPPRPFRLAGRFARRSRLAFCLALPLLAATPAAAAAQVSDSAGAAVPAAAETPASHVGAPSTAVAARVSGQMVIDGRLNEPVWRTAVPVTSFTQLEPFEGQPGSELTLVRIAFDDDALYVGAELRDRQPVRLRVARRDASFSDSDVFAVALDSYHDHQTAFRFVVNASGVRRDEVITATGGGDTSWDPIWEAATQVTDSGWTAEFRIPFSQLRFGREDVQTWGIQLERRIARNQEHAIFAFTSRLQRGGPPRFGHLTGLQGIATSHRLEVLPYAYGRASYRTTPVNPAAGFANPYRDPSDYARGVGADLKYRLTSNFTVDATLNPDFGQVEVDPALINLSQFEVRFEERRPFFVEGAEIFRFGSSLSRDAQLLYSRRVGRPPQGSVPSSAVYSDVPETATILGAAKLTGKTANGWSAGILEAVTGRESAPYVNAAQEGHAAVVEPLTSYFTARVRRTSLSGSTAGGGLLTAVNRRLDDEVLARRLRSSAYVGGADFRHEWGNRDYSLSAQIASSLVSGRREAITAAQLSSARYFQRPDARHLALDTTATQLVGYNAFVAVGKFGGAWQRNLTLSATSPRYEINDLGFQPSADRLGVDVNVSYRDNGVGRLFRRWDVNVGPDATWNYGGDRVGGSVGIRGGVQLLNYWNVNANYDFRPAALDDRLTRGGPLAVRPREQSFGMFVNSNPRNRTTLNVQANQGWNAAGGSSQRLETNVGVRVASNVEVRVGPQLNRSHTVAQYVTSVRDATMDATFGRRYIFAPIDQTTLSMSTRLNVAFSPRLTLEMFAQPFVSSGDYGALKQLRGPGRFEFDEYGRTTGTMTRDSTGIYTIDPDGSGPAARFGVSDRDFSFRSLRGNAVLRWEWSAGSTLFLVWQQSRALDETATGLNARTDRIGRVNAYSDAAELFRIRPDNVLQLKVTYWLNP